MADDGVLPGDVYISEISLVSANGTLDMSKMFTSGEVYESIFTPGIMAVIRVIDSEDYIGLLKIAGGEILTFSFRPPGGTTNTYTLIVNTVTDSTNPSQKVKVYTLNCISKEALDARANPVTKSYNTQISNIVQDVFSSYLKSSKSLSTEATKGIQKILSPNKKPLSLIKELKSKAVSSSHASSAYVFFENKNGFYFVTIESLFSNPILKNLVRLDTVGSSIYNLTHNNIIAYHLERQGSAADRIGLGSLSYNVQQYDARTNKYTQTTKTPTSYSGNMVNSLFSSMFGGSVGKNIFLNKDSVAPETFLGDAAPDKAAYMAALMQNQLNIEVAGDTVFYAGGCVNTSISKASAITGYVTEDPLINGKFMIAKLAHIIQTADKTPRYTNSMQLIKTDFNS